MSRAAVESVLADVVGYITRDDAANFEALGLSSGDLPCQAGAALTTPSDELGVVPGTRSGLFFH